MATYVDVCYNNNIIFSIIHLQTCDLQPFKLAAYEDEGTSVCSVAWSFNGTYLSLGLANGKVIAVAAQYCTALLHKCFTTVAPPQIS